MAAARDGCVHPERSPPSPVDHSGAAVRSGVHGPAGRLSMPRVPGYPGNRARHGAERTTRLGGALMVAGDPIDWEGVAFVGVWGASAVGIQLRQRRCLCMTPLSTYVAYAAGAY